MKLCTVGTGKTLVAEACASSLVNDEILIDCGMGVFKSFVKNGIDFTKIRTILITHLHADHFYDLPAFATYYRNYPSNDPLDIYLPEDGIEAFHLIMKYAMNLDDDYDEWMPKNIFLHEYKDGDGFNFDNVHVSARLVDHGPMKPAFGFILENDGKKIGFSGDTKPCNEIDTIVEESDVIVIDTSVIDRGIDAHMGVDDIYDYCKRYPGKRFFATHMEKESRERMKREKAFANLVVPNDGEEFII